MNERVRREAAMGRRFGLRPERQAELKAFNEKQTDWEATCRACGTQLFGTLAQLRKHADDCPARQ